MADVLRAHERLCLCAMLAVEYHLHSQPPQEMKMPQNSKDSKGGKTHPVKETADPGGKKSDKGTADKKPESPTGSHNKGEKKTTP